MNRLACLCLASGLLLAGDSYGVRPRGDATDYPAHESAGGITVAGAIVPPEQCRRMFSADVDKAGYVVVEVAIYPDNRAVELSSADFMLRMGPDSDATRAVNGRRVAATLYKHDDRNPRIGRNIDVETTSSIGYESGRDPITGQRRNGVYTEGGVGVGTAGRNPNYPSPSADRDRAITEQELIDRSLPEGPTRRPVAGYLFFPKPSKKVKNATFEMTYYGDPEKIRLVLPPAPGK